jgi:hypothetical protein
MTEPGAPRRPGADYGDEHSEPGMRLIDIDGTEIWIPADDDPEGHAPFALAAGATMEPNMEWGP